MIFRKKMIVSFFLSLVLCANFILFDNSKYIADASPNEITTYSKSSNDGKWIKSNNGKWWYRHSDGSYTKNNWEKISGYWYYFDESGWMVVGWKKIEDKWYYFNQNGEGTEGQMRTGTLYKNGKKHVFNSGGSLYITELPVNRTRQSKDNWCWAACSEMVGGYEVNNYRTQSDIVEYIKGSSSIDEGGTNDEIRRSVDYASRNSKVSYIQNSPFSYEKVIDKIDANKPFILTILWSSTNGHAIVCSGYNLNARSLQCIDPIYPNENSYYSYSGLVNGMTISSGTGNYDCTIYY